MSWSWSHTVDGLMNAQANLELLPLVKLQEILAEWLAYDAGIVKEKQKIVDDLLDEEEREIEAIAKALDAEEITPGEHDLQVASAKEYTVTQTKRELMRYHPSASMDAFDADVYKKELKRIRKENREFIHTLVLSSPYGCGAYASDPQQTMRQARRDATDSVRRSLAESIWSRMEELATCTNGGWEAYCCPFGCGPHMVSFSSLAERREEALEKARAARKKKT